MIQQLKHFSHCVSHMKSINSCLDCTCFKSVISGWPSVCWWCWSAMPGPVETVSWILCPKTKATFKVTVKFPLGWNCCRPSCSWQSWWRCRFSIVWQNSTGSNCKCDVINCYIPSIVTSSDGLKYNLLEKKICTNNVNLSLVHDSNLTHLIKVVWESPHMSQNVS